MWHSGSTQYVQFSSRWYLGAWKSPYALLHPASEKFPQRCLWNSSSVGLIDDGPLSSFQGRLSSASCFSISLLQVIGAQKECLKLLSASDLLRSKPLVKGTFPASPSARPCPFPPACPGQFIHRSFRRWMSTIDTSQSELPIPLFTFCSILIESVRMTACVIRLSPLQAIHRRAWVTASTSTQTDTIKMMMMIAFI